MGGPEMHCTAFVAILLVIFVHRGICLVCYTCYSENSFKDCDQQRKMHECPPGINDTCTTYTMLKKSESGKKIKFFAKACSQGKFCSMADYHCCATDKCNAGKVRTQPLTGTGEKREQSTTGTGEKGEQSTTGTGEKGEQSTTGTGVKREQLASGLLLGAWAISQLVLTVLLY